MPSDRPDPPLRLPKRWPDHVCSAMLHVFSLARLACTSARGWAAKQINIHLRTRAELGRCYEEIAQLQEVMRIKDARMTRVPAHRRPYYSPTERMSILELRAARGWSLEQTARVFLLTAATIASWVRRVDEGGPTAFVRLIGPVNKFPDFVRCIVQRLRALCPMLGKVKIAEALARAGLHLGATTAGRILKEPQAPEPTDAEPTRKKGIVTSKYPNHLWFVDLTTVSIGPCFWTAWSPFSLLQCGPFCWWVGVVVDHYSRRIMGVTVFRKEPTAAVRAAGPVATELALRHASHAGEGPAGSTPQDGGGVPRRQEAPPGRSPPACCVGDEKRSQKRGCTHRTARLDSIPVGLRHHHVMWPCLATRTHSHEVLDPPLCYSLWLTIKLPGPVQWGRSRGSSWPRRPCRRGWRG